MGFMLLVPPLQMITSRLPASSMAAISTESSYVTPPGTPSGLRDLILLLPDLTVLLMRLMREPRIPMRAKLVAGFGIGYVLSPIDLLPSLLLGPIGLVDDLLVVAATLSQLLNHVHPDVVRSHWSGKPRRR